MSNNVIPNFKTSPFFPSPTAEPVGLQMPYDLFAQLYLLPMKEERKTPTLANIEKIVTVIPREEYFSAMPVTTSLENNVERKDNRELAKENKVEEKSVPSESIELCDGLKSYFTSEADCSGEIAIAAAIRKLSSPLVQSKERLAIYHRFFDLSKKFNFSFSPKKVNKFTNFVLKAKQCLTKQNSKSLSAEFPDKPIDYLQKRACNAIAKKIFLFKLKQSTKPRPLLFNRKVTALQQDDKVFIIGYQKIIGTGGFNVAILVEDLDKKKLRVYRQLRDCSEPIMREAQYEALLHQTLQKFPRIGKGIVHLKAVIEQKSSFGLILDYCDGGSLATHFHKMSPNVKKPLLVTLFHTLARIHGKGFVHGDLKEDNVLLMKKNPRKWYPKLADFGKTFTERNPIYRGGDFKYMAPEAFYGDTPKTAKIDSWAAGLLLFKMKYYRTPSLIAIFSQLGALTKLSKLDTSLEGREKTTNSINKSLQKLFKKLDSNDPYDQVITLLLQINPAKRISCKEAYERLKKIPVRSFAMKVKQLETFGYFMTGSKQEAHNRLKDNLAMAKWHFPQCTIVKEEGESQLSFVYTKTNDAKLEACHTPCELKMVDGVLVVGFNNNVNIPIGIIMNKYFRLMNLS